MTAARKPREPDIRIIFDKLSADSLLDDRQIGLLAGRAVVTIKRWRRLGTAPPHVLINGLPRYRVADVRAWLRGGELLHRRLACRRLRRSAQSSTTKRPPGKGGRPIDLKVAWRPLS